MIVLQFQGKWRHKTRTYYFLAKLCLLLMSAVYYNWKMDSAGFWKSKYSGLFAEITWIINTWGIQWLWSWTRGKGMHILLNFA